ncbi:MAG: winged helix-turn-helix transcriptional regulator [Phycisphaerales bacterium]|nr:winged helix-turn-helix transcriptional regulator [Phycisphaerales bacterium]
MPTPTTPIQARDRELADAFTGCLASAIRQADRLVASVFDSHLREIGLRGTQMTLLGALARLGTPSQRELAEATHTDATTLSRNLDRLVERGLATRADCCHDKRVRRYALTDDGRQLLTDSLPHWRAAQAEVAERLGADLCDVLSRASDAMSEG